MDVDISQILQILSDLSPLVQSLPPQAPTGTPRSTRNLNQVKRKFHELAYFVLGDAIPAPPPATQASQQPDEDRPAQRRRVEPSDDDRDEIASNPESDQEVISLFSSCPPPNLIP